MRYWIRTRRLWVLAVVTSALGAVGHLVGERTIALPTFFGNGGASLALMTLLPVGWAVAVADAWASARQAAEARPSRRLVGVDALAFVLVTLVAACSFSTLAGAVGPWRAGFGPVLVVTGLACAVTLRRGAGAGALVVSLVAFMTTTYAATAPWACYIRVLQSDGDLTWSIRCGTALMSAAAAMLATNRVRYALSEDQSVE